MRRVDRDDRLDQNDSFAARLVGMPWYALRPDDGEPRT